MAKYSEKRQIGNIAEDISAMFLVKSGHRILDRNYLKKWGELDIVSVDRSDTIHFIEVKCKTVGFSRETLAENHYNSVSRQVSQKSFTDIDFKIELSRESPDEENDEYRPEDNVHYHKQKRMMRAIETYIMENPNKVGDREWQIDVLAVTLDFSRETAIMKHIENVIFDV
ncbi:MAG: YraN family protein [Methylomonas sp.]|nr:YraN family protein [Methylomonas sp.]